MTKKLTVVQFFKLVKPYTWLIGLHRNGTIRRAWFFGVVPPAIRLWQFATQLTAIIVSEQSLKDWGTTLSGLHDRLALQRWIFSLQSEE